MKITIGGRPSPTKNGNGYQTIHRRIKNYRGRACEHKCVDCTSQADQWSHRHNTDPTDIYNYYPRCRKCHDIYDSYLKGCAR